MFNVIRKPRSMNKEWLAGIQKGLEVSFELDPQKNQEAFSRQGKGKCSVEDVLGYENTSAGETKA